MIRIETTRTPTNIMFARNSLSSSAAPAAGPIALEVDMDSFAPITRMWRIADTAPMTKKLRKSKSDGEVDREQ